MVSHLTRIEKMEKFDEADFEEFISAPDWRSFFSELSMEGVRYVVKPGINTVRRVMWSILVTFGLCFMLFQIQARFSYFQSRPTAVDIQYIQNSNLRFPSVTICNSNYVNFTKAKLIGNYERIIDALHKKKWITFNPLLSLNFRN